MKMVSIKCPNCGSSVELNGDLEKGTCNYCGTEIYNENALEKKKVEVSGSIVVNGVDITKELENALNFYKS